MHIVFAAHEETARAYLIDCLRADSDANRSAYLMVPEQFSMYSEMHLLDALARDAVMDIRVSSFGALSREVLQRVGGLRHVYLNESGRRMLLHRLLQEGDYPLFGDATVTGGVTQKCLETLRSLRAEQIDASALQQLGKSAQDATLLSHKLDEIARLLEAYEAACIDRYLDNESRLALLEAQLPQAVYLQDTRFYFDAFHSMSRQELAVLAALEQLGAQVVVAVVGTAEALKQSDPYEPYRTGRRFYQTLLEICTVAPDVLHLQDQGAVLPVLSDLAQQVFGYDAMMPLPAAGEAVRLIAAPSSIQEVQYAAATIRRLVIEKGYRYRDFNLAVCNSEEYFPLVRRVFRSAGIPVFIDERVAMRKNPIVSFLLNALDAMTGDMANEALFAMLKSGIPLLDAEEIMELERHATARHLRGSMYWDDRFFERDPRLRSDVPWRETLAAERLALARTARDKLQDLCRALWDSTRVKANGRAFATAVYHFISQEAVLAGVEAYQERLQTVARTEVQSENTQVFAYLATLLDQVVELTGETDMTFTAFADVLRQGLEDMSIGIVPPAQDQVMVGALSRMRTGRTEIQWVLGLSDRWFPSQVDDERHVFSQEEERFLEQHGIVLPSLADRLVDDEALSLYETLTRAKNCLFLSHPLSDAANGSMHESHLFARVRACCSEVSVQSTLAELPHWLPYDTSLLMRETMSGLRDWRRGFEDHALASAAMAQHSAAYEVLQANDPEVTGIFLKAGLQYNNRRSPLHASLARTLYNGPREGRISVTEIESMRSCPYRHFVQYGLRLEEAPHFDIESRDIGTMLHNSLESFTRDLLADPSLLRAEDAAICARMDGYLDEQAGLSLGVERTEYKRHQAVLAKVRRNAHKAGTHIARQLRSGHYRTEAAEIAFGRTGALPALILHCDTSELALEGRIDRLDVFYTDDAAYVRVIDYKTGSKTFDISLLLDGLDIQLAVYLMVAMMKEQGSKAGGMFYLSLKKPFIKRESEDAEVIQAAHAKEVRLDGLMNSDDLSLLAQDAALVDGDSLVVRFANGKSRSNVISDDDFETLMQHVVQLSTDISEAILQGDIAIFPYEKGNATACAFCTYGALCRRNDQNDNNRTRLLKSYDWRSLTQRLASMKEDAHG